jgi:hypothetical protein
VVVAAGGLSGGGDGQTLIMLTAILVLLAATLVFLAGEAVRGQCRRMLSRPVILPMGETMSPEAALAA